MRSGLPRTLADPYAQRRRIGGGAPAAPRPLPARITAGAALVAFTVVALVPTEIGAQSARLVAQATARDTTRGRDLAVDASLAAADSAWARAARDSACAGYRRHAATAERPTPRALLRLATCDGGPAGLHRELALAGFERLLQGDPHDRDAVLGRAQVLAWGRRYAAADEAYRRWLERAPDDTAARLGLAQSLAWSGAWSEALEHYSAVARSGAWPEAEKGEARVVGWRGELARSEALWRALTERHPQDAEAWVGLAQVQRWRGALDDADRSLRRARAAAPGDPDVRAQWGWLRAERAGAGSPALAHVTDSDGNRSTTAEATLAGPTRAGTSAQLQVRYRDARLLQLAGSSRGVRGGVAWRSADARWRGRASAGGSWLSSRSEGEGSAAGAGAGGFVPAWALQLSGQPRRALTVGLSVARSPFDETAPLIANRVHLTTLDGSVALALPAGVGLEGGATRTRVGGGRHPNEGGAAMVAGRWRARRTLVLGVSARRFGYDSGARGDGYFAPRRYTLVEGSVQRDVGGDLGWGATFDAGVGRQGIRLVAGSAVAGSVAARGELVVRYRPSPGTAIEGVVSASSAATSVTSSGAGYRARTFALRGRLPLSLRGDR